MNSVIYKINDLVWTDFGYAVIQDLGENRKQVEIFIPQQETESEQELNTSSNEDLKVLEKEKEKEKEQQQKSETKEIPKENDKNSEKEQDKQQQQDKQEKQQEQKEEKPDQEQEKEKEKTEQKEKEPEKTEQQQKQNDKQQEKEKQPEQTKEIEKQQQQPAEEEKKLEEQKEEESKQQEDKNQKDIILPTEQQQKEQETLLQQIVKLKLKNCPISYLYIPLKNLKKTITIKVKTFYGNREIITLKNIPISLPISHIKSKIIQKSGYTNTNDQKTFYNKRLIYPMASLQLLSDDTNLGICMVPDGANLVLMVQMSFFWDNNMKGNWLQLSNGGLTVKKPQETDFQVILGNLPLVSGRCYFEVKIQQFQQIEEDGDDLLIGVARKEINLNQPYFETKPGLIWGYVPLRAEKLGPDLNFIPYGHKCKKGDIVGVLMEFKSGIGSLSFYKNKEKCNNPAFTNLTGTFYPAISFPYGEFQITLYPQASLPINL